MDPWEDTDAPALQFADVLAFNDQILAISKIGLPIDIGLLGAKVPIAKTLEDLSTKIAVQVESGRSIESVIVGSHWVPKMYQESFGLWLSGGRTLVALSPIMELAHWRNDTLGREKYSLIRLGILVFLAYCGSIYLALFHLPKVQAIYDQIGTEPGLSISVLRYVQVLLPYWAFGIPIAIMAMWVPWIRKERRWRFRLLNHRKEQLASYHSIYAASLSKVVDSEWMLGSLGKSAEVHDSVLTNSTDLPPLIQWAMERGGSDQERSDALLFASRTYGESAGISKARWQKWLPVCLSALVGGVIVLAFGLGVFAPVIELMKTIALP